MASKVLLRLARVAMVVGGVTAFVAATADAARPERPGRRRASRGFSLFAGNVNVKMNVNQVECNINNIGETCVDPTNSPVLGGGFWPRGTPDQYIFNGGLQIAAIVGGTGHPWVGDTVGAFFFDATGLLGPHGEGRTATFNGLSADDIANWPSAAYVNDTSLFSPGLIGRKTASQQDTWVRYWDGNTNLVAGRSHPMGLLVEQRGLAWNFPSGNQDIVYFLYRFVNITSNQLSAYAGLANAGYSPSDIADIHAIASEFHSRVESVYNISLPDAGVPFTNTYAAFGQDPDVGQAGSNYSNANFPFALSFAYKSDFREPLWQFPPSVFGAPFAAAPGFEGVKFLASPAGGIAVWTNSINAAGAFADRRTVQQLWRLLSGNLIPADGLCSIPLAQVAARRFCSSWPNAADSRFYMSSGPYTLNPGESSVIVVAYVHAAPVASMACIAAQGACPGGAWALAPLIGTDVKPGFPVDGARLVAGSDSLRNVERAMGWVSHSDADGDLTIEQNEAIVVRRSLFDKALVAQAVFDSKFLLPFAPEAPVFFVVPGDNKVTVVWQPSTTETDGDPFFAIASQQTIGGNPNPLYDPNFRLRDVEGYRIWRGRTAGQMEVIAQFDYAGTIFRDYTGAFITDATGNQCAPEIGITASCPRAFQVPAPVGGPTVFNPISLAGNVVQVPPGGRVALASGNVFVVSGDTAVTGGASGFPSLTDTGVPFIYEDNAVRNGFTYFYAVTAFDINSVASGPSSLESPIIAKQVTPRLPSGQEVPGAIGANELLGGDNSVLNTAAAMPAVDATTGIFAGPMPPTNGISLGFGAFLSEVLGTGAMDVKLDSIIPGSALTAVRPTIYWFTATVGGAPVVFSVPFQLDLQPDGSFLPYFDAPGSGGGVFRAASLDHTAASRFGGDSTFSLYGRVNISSAGSWALTMKGRADANAHPAAPKNGSRWWEGAGNENIADPNGVNCSSPPPIGNSGFSCTLTDLSRNSGQLTGVDLMGITSYFTIGSAAPARDWEGITSTVFRQADFKFYWGAGGTVDSVVDVTHKVRVPFSPRIGPSWGFLNVSSFAGIGTTRDANTGRLTWSDVGYVAPIPSYLGNTITGGAAAAATANGGAVLENTAVLNPINFASSTYAGTATLAAGASNGTGFILYLNGNFFLMRMAALPAAGTVWNHRAYAGHVTGTPGSYGFTNDVVRPPNAPGIRLRLSFTGSTLDPAVTTAADLERVHTVPDPYYVTNQLEITASTKVLRFVQLPARAIVRIYSTSGILINVLTHNDAGGGGEMVWNLRNRNNQFVASGVYFYHVETPDGRKKIGRFTVVNFAQ